MNKLKRLIAAVLSAAMLTVSAPVFAEYESYAQQAAATDNQITENDAPEEEEAKEYSKNYKAYELLAGYIQEYYIDDSLDKEEVMKQGISDYLDENDEALWGMLKAMFQSLDPWSEFFTGDEYRDYENGVNRTFYGIGIGIKENDGYIEITGFSEENSLAEQTGFKIGDKIVAVDGEDCVGKPLSDVRSLIVGDLGTTVNITVLRDGEYIDLVATRTEVRTATATGVIFEGNIGYMKIASFGDTTAAEVAEILDRFKEKGVEKYILDLRNNGGGKLDAAVEIAQMMVPKGKIIDVVYRNEENNTSYYSERTTKDFEMVTLVNGNTASSSEVLASAIQDSGAGRLVGETTYGKAVIQNVFPLSNGMFFKLTIGEYKTRNGRSINYVGLEPDEYVKNYNQAIDATQYAKFDFRTRNSVGDFAPNVLAAKEKLGMLGYYSGNSENNVFSTELKNAVEKFQTEVGLAPSGVLDVATQVKLEENFEALKTVVDVQLETAYEMLGGDPEKLYK